MKTRFKKPNPDEKKAVVLLLNLMIKSGLLTSDEAQTALMCNGLLPDDIIERIREREKGEK